MYNHEPDDETIPLLSSFPKQDYNASGDLELSARGKKRKSSTCKTDCSMPKKMKPADRKAKNAIILCILVAFLFMVAEFVGGYLANSIAIFSDALHMLSDIAGLLLSLVGIIMGSQSATDRFTFGFKRLEIVASLLSILLIWAMAAVLMYTSILRLFNPPMVDGEIMLIVACIGMASNFIMFAILHFGGAGHAHGGHGHSHGGKDAHGGHGHSHGGKHAHSHGHTNGGVNKKKSNLTNVQLVDVNEKAHNKTPGGSSSTPSKGHGHSHGGKKCTGHSKKGKTKKSNSNNGGQTLGYNNTTVDSIKPQIKGHGHSHGGKNSAGHGHSHGGKKCTGHSKVKKEGEGNDTSTEQDSRSKYEGSSTKIEDKVDPEHGHLQRHKTSDNTGTLEGNYRGWRNIKSWKDSLSPFSRKQSSGSETKHTQAPETEEIMDNENVLNGDKPQDHGGPKNINVRSAMIHVMGDLLQNFGVIIAAGCIWWNPEKNRIADPICTLIFAVGTVLLSLRVIRDAGEVLMDMSPGDIDIEMIRERLCKIPGVTGVHDLHCWFMAYGEKSLSCHIQVNEDASGSVCTQGVLGQAQAVLQKFKISHTTIQVEDPDHKPGDHSNSNRTPGICVTTETPVTPKPIVV